MANPTGFIEIPRQERKYRHAAPGSEDYTENWVAFPEPELRSQAARCMDCGIPFCHDGCPVNNQIPNWNNLAYKDKWEAALTDLHSTNNFPEFTGRICPAPCEASCVLNIEDSPVTIKSIECAIVDKGWNEGWIQPVIAPHKTGFRIAVVGSGPAGLACAQQLARAGHEVTVFEKSGKPGGLLRYGIPDFKMDKFLIDRRVAQMTAEGVAFRCNINVGVDIAAKDVVDNFDAVVLAGGSEVPRDAAPPGVIMPGRDLKGIHYAMEYLPQQNRRNSGEAFNADADPILAAGKHVIVIGGGDTGSDCIGTAVRQGALSITQLEIMPCPSEKENKGLTWPGYPHKMRHSPSQDEAKALAGGFLPMFTVTAKKFLGENGKLQMALCERVEWVKEGNERKPMPIEGSEFLLKADLVLIAAGFTGAVQPGLIDGLGITLDRGKVPADTKGYLTAHSSGKIFAAGDMRRGQSLVVWAIREGRQAAASVDFKLTGRRTEHLARMGLD